MMHLAIDGIGGSHGPKHAEMFQRDLQSKFTSGRGKNFVSGCCQSLMDHVTDGTIIIDN